MPREFRFRPALFKRSSKIQWPSLPPSLPPLSPRSSVQYSLSKNITSPSWWWNKEEERKCKFRDRTPKTDSRLPICWYGGRQKKVGSDNLSLGVSRTRVAISKERDRRPALLLRATWPRCFRKRGEKGYATTHWLIYYAMLFRPRVGRNIQICILTCRPNNPFTLRIPRGVRSPLPSPP